MCSVTRSVLVLYLPLLKKGARSVKENSARSLKIIICFAVMAVIILVYYNHTANKADTAVKEETTESSKVQDVILRNLDMDYPPTPKEVVKFYSDISECLYGEKYTEDELDKMADQQLKMFDSALAANNPRDKYLVNLKSEVATMKEQNCVIYGYSTSASTDVEYFTKDGRDCARLYCSYSMRLNKKLAATKEIYVLRKDDAGHWKIYGWQKVNKNTDEIKAAEPSSASGK